jgi:modification methylase
VAFGTLVENGYVKPGAVLFDAKRRWKATVRVDGSLEAEGDTGSIHKLGATLQNAPSCNGWTFWHVEDGGVLKPLDSIRQDYLTQLG